MAIGFARLQFVQRSCGQNVCAKAAYNSKDKINFVGNDFSPAKIYDWSKGAKPVYHEILIPEHVNKNFKVSEYLWNAVETKEVRVNSVTALEMVLALPDDRSISLEDKIQLTKTFINENYVSKGLAAQIDIHQPDQKYRTENGEIDKYDHNWHAHVLMTTRRFTNDGDELDGKARDLMPIIRGGNVVDGEKWGKLWAIHQNHYFEAKGISLRVDPNGIVSQKHLGPVRMRRALALIEENSNLVSLNQLESENPEKILDKLLETKSIFSVEDVENYISKHVLGDFKNDIRKEFWKQSSIVQLIDGSSNNPLNKFTSQFVLDEERKILRLSEQIFDEKALKLVDSKFKVDSKSQLTPEQSKAFDSIVQGKKLSCIEGYAGTGKSYLLAALKKTYENEGYKVRAFGPDNATANVLKDKGFQDAENIYRFLFLLNNEKREIGKNKEIWIVDEAGKLGNKPLLEFLKAAKKYNVQVVLSGDSSQMSSVERGGMFKVLSINFGAELLEDIQRQKSEVQRDIAKKLAKGKMSEAIDAIIKSGGIKWTTTKKEALEELMKGWMADQNAFPDSSYMIIAHTNAEVKALNEMVRSFRKNQGELGEIEFQCETSKGKIYVSTGDKIEFRKKDKDLAITNGMVGTLIEASLEKFTVLVKDKQATRKISFDPRQYFDFQLGYATTCYRSQGATVDRAYVAHSPYLNKEMLYVGLTRHVQKAYLFVSSDTAKNLSDLKRQAMRTGHKETTLEFLTQDQIEKNEELDQRVDHITKLKASSSLVEKFKGHALSNWDSLSSSVNAKILKHRDLKPDKAFFNPNISVQNFRGNVVQLPSISDDLILKETNSSNIKETIKPLTPLQEKTKQNRLDKLSDSHKILLKEYYKQSNEAASLYSIVTAESEGIIEKEKSTLHYKDWQQACGQRNKLASDINQSLSKNTLNQVFGKKELEILKSRADRFELLKQQKLTQPIDIDSKLKENFDALLFNLFPDGPSRKNRSGLRFGSNGSLAVVCQGKDIGSYYDHERGEGGGPLQLIQRSLGIDIAEARTWAKNFLGETHHVPSSYTFKKNFKAVESSEWACLKPNTPAPLLKEISAKLDSNYIEVARHPYHDEKGEILCYTLRLVNRDDLSKKMVLPLSYGTVKGEEPQWVLRAFQSNEKPLYNLHLLQTNPKSKVLIVEGEKTADAASKMFIDKNIICLTWSGGSSATSKTNWSPLKDREVIIWPDNDAAGYKAADNISSDLRRVGVQSLHVVDKDILAREFPNKWDLADPTKHEKQFLHDLILNAKEKCISIEQLALKDESPVTKLWAKEVLCRVEERLRPSLEEKWGGKNWEIRNEILSETQRVLNGREILEKDLKNEFGELARSISNFSMLQEATTGLVSTKPEMIQIKSMFSNIREFSNISNGIKKSELYEYVVDKTLSTYMELGGHGNKKFDIIEPEIISMINKNYQQSIKMNVELDNQKMMDLSI